MDFRFVVERARTGGFTDFSLMPPLLGFEGEKIPAKLTFHRNLVAVEEEDISAEEYRNLVDEILPSGVPRAHEHWRGKASLSPGSGLPIESLRCASIPVPCHAGGGGAGKRLWARSVRVRLSEPSIDAASLGLRPAPGRISSLA